MMAPPEGNGLQWANYQVTCGNVQNHAFATGFDITGFVTTQNGDSVERQGNSAAFTVDRCFDHEVGNEVGELIAAWRGGRRYLDACW